MMYRSRYYTGNEKKGRFRPNQTSIKSLKQFTTGKYPLSIIQEYKSAKNLGNLVTFDLQMINFEEIIRISPLFLAKAAQHGITNIIILVHDSINKQNYIKWLESNTNIESAKITGSSILIKCKKK